MTQKLATGGILRRPNPDNPGGSVAGYAGAILSLPANAPCKPCLIDMADDLSRITWLIEALRSACAGADEEALQTLASVILDQCKDFGEKFEIARAAERSRA